MNMLIFFDSALMRKLLYHDPVFHNFNNKHLVPDLLDIAENLPSILGALISEQATLQTICRARLLFIDHCMSLQVPALSMKMYQENWRIQLEIANRIMNDPDPIFSDTDILSLRFGARSKIIEIIQQGATILDVVLTEPGLICVNPG
ncbi:MAG TPA: hypothetical protein PLS49_07770 [Candidatus Woesebacteria bacterium]|nr:hypothetical protein [Candidatus Woesebacteria bacterium]